MEKAHLKQVPLYHNFYKWKNKIATYNRFDTPVAVTPTL